jgi:TonB family protein
MRLDHTLSLALIGAASLLAAPAIGQTAPNQSTAGQSTPGQPNGVRPVPRLAPTQLAPGALRLGGTINLYDARVGLVLQGQLAAPATVKPGADGKPRTATLTVTIDAAGHVTGARVVKASGDALFDSAALAATQPFTAAGGRKLPVASDLKIRNRAMTEGVKVVLKHGAGPKRARKPSTLERLRSIRPGQKPGQTPAAAENPAPNPEPAPSKGGK